MRVTLFSLVLLGLAVQCPPSAHADVSSCGGDQFLGALRCTTSGPASIDGQFFVGDGRSSAQLQWRGVTRSAAPGVLELRYTYDGIYNTLFSKIGMRLTVRQANCAQPQTTSRDWVDPSLSDGVSKRIAVPVHCAGAVNYTITSRAATYSPAGSFVGRVTLNTLIVSHSR